MIAIVAVEFSTFQRPPATLPDPLQNYISQMWFAADAGRIPQMLAVPLGRIAPGGLAVPETLPHGLLRFAQHHGDILMGVQSIADKERDHNDVFGPRHLVAFANPRIFLEEERIHLGVVIGRTDQFDLALDGFAGILIVARAMSGDEESDLGRVGSARERMLFHDLASAGQ